MTKQILKDVISHNLSLRYCFKGSKDKEAFEPLCLRTVIASMCNNSSLNVEFYMNFIDTFEDVPR